MNTTVGPLQTGLERIEESYQHTVKEVKTSANASEAPASTIGTEELWKRVTISAHDFGGWEAIIARAEQALQEASKKVTLAEVNSRSTNHNSEQGPVNVCLEDALQAYSKFLTRFPYCFGYWKKYADLVFTHHGERAAVDIYERAVREFPNSIDLWVHYCTLGIRIGYPAGEMRSLFQRGASILEGFDPNSFTFYDLYLKWEEDRALEENSYQNVLILLAELIKLPIYHGRRYLERFLQIAQVRSTAELFPGNSLAGCLEEGSAYLEARKRFRDVDLSTPIKKSEILVDDLIDVPIKQQVIAKVGQDALKGDAIIQRIWKYEEKIKRPYFHVKPLDQGQLENWRNYLLEEEELSDPERVIGLYERCMVACALYPEFWFHYINYLSERKDNVNLERVYKRAIFTVIPVNSPSHEKLFLSYVRWLQSTNTEVKQVFDSYLRQNPQAVSVWLSFHSCSCRRGEKNNTGELEGLIELLDEFDEKWKEKDDKFFRAKSHLCIEYFASGKVDPDNRICFLKEHLLSNDDKAYYNSIRIPAFLPLHVIELLVNKAAAAADGIDPTLESIREFVLFLLNLSPNRLDHEMKKRILEKTMSLINNRLFQADPLTIIQLEGEFTKALRLGHRRLYRTDIEKANLRQPQNQPEDELASVQEEHSVKRFKAANE